MRVLSLSGGVNLALMLIMLGGTVLYHHQGRKLETLTLQYQQLEKENINMISTLADLNSMAQALVDYGFRTDRLEEDSERDRKLLQDALGTLPCAGEPLPDDVIRMQYDLFGEKE